MALWGKNSDIEFIWWPNDQRAGLGVAWVVVQARIVASRFWERNFILTEPLSTRDKKQKNIGKLLSGLHTAN